MVLPEDVESASLRAERWAWDHLLVHTNIQRIFHSGVVAAVGMRFELPFLYDV